METSYKNTFEPKTFASNTFACGTFRGRGIFYISGDRHQIQLASDDRILVSSVSANRPSLAVSSGTVIPLSLGDPQ